MTNNNHKTSLIVPTQLPEFIRDNPDYANFVLFIQAYYEWMEQSGNVMDYTKNLLLYDDIDNTTTGFLQYFKNDFLPYFPKDALTDQSKAIKFAKQIYDTKGTPASYKLLFKLLYNSDFDVFYTKDAVLKASAGVWYISKSLKLNTTNKGFLNINNLRLFGETSKSIATVENSVASGTKIEVFISNIERVFQSGEYVRVVDSNNQDVLYNGQQLRAKIVGQISQINIDPNNRGLLYQPGDPVIVYNGLSSNTAHGAVAQVGTTTSGSIQRILVVNGGFGYRPDPNTSLSFTNAPGAIATVGSMDANPLYTANVTLVPRDSISLKTAIQIGANSYNFSNAAFANANTTLAQAFTFENFATYPISSVIVQNGGGGINKIPSLAATSLYPNDIQSNADLSALGILAPIQIVSGGAGYNKANDTIVISGGTGYGAYANITSVDANGAITGVAFQSGALYYPLGGMGYSLQGLPTITVQRANTQINAANATLFAPGILGAGATFALTVDRVGAITTINILDYGEDYVSAPSVSLKVQDIVVSNASIFNLPEIGDTIYQGASLNVASYTATVNSISVLAPDANTLNTLYNIRVFNYNSSPNPNSFLTINDKNINLKMANTQYDSTYNQNGVRTYGDGTAKATASYLNGLVVGQGQYLTTQGQLSSYDVLQSTNYNNYTYMITVEKEIEKYRSALLNMVHPSGTKLLGRYAMKAESRFDTDVSVGSDQGYSLAHYTGALASNASIFTDFTNKSNNIVKFDNLSGANIATFLFPGSILEMSYDHTNVHSEVVSVDWVSNTATIATNTWLTFANVANIIANANSNTINIVSLTNSYNIINNGHYSNTQYPLMDIVYPGDNISIANNSVATVKSVNYVTGVITLNSNLTANANSLMSVNRPFATNSVKIYGTLGLQYFPELTTESGQTIITESGEIILLG